MKAIYSEPLPAKAIAEAMISGAAAGPEPPLPVHEAIVSVPVKASIGKIRSLVDPCWDVRIYFLCPATTESYGKLVRRFKPEFQDVPITLALCADAIDKSGVQVVVIGLTEWKNNADYAGTLAHECFHATQYILEHRGVELSSCTSEAYAYLIDSLVRRGTTLLNKTLVTTPNL